ncbi:replication initiator protein A [Bacillus cereus]|uniref:replication initiator protein A n=1 Tax=Bacillus cereus TaxID=1396 RepID=UPI002405BA41|nr:replication initiator protein A [Bacillus cereus]MDF9525044.1 replication initiator protein A [Bacillus cereus]MDF9564775.1 replication initiator protein A [Bacillus cereus]
MATTNKERRINGMKASTDLYFQLFQYLFYEPKYRKLSNNARVLYSILRDRYKLSVQTSQVKDTFIDEDGNIFCILDNTELSYLLTVSEPTAIKAKKELHAASLLEEVSVKDEANRLYVLEPELTTDNWTYMSELDELRKQKKEKKNERIKKQKEKKMAEKAQKKIDESQPSIGDLNNFSHQGNEDSTKNGDLNNFSHVTKESLENTKVFNIQNDFNYFSKYVGKSISDLIIDFYNQYFKTTKYAKMELTKMCEEENAVLVFESIKRAIDGEADKPIAYIKKTITNWNAANCDTLEDIQKYEEKHRNKKKQMKAKGSYTPKNKTVRKEMVPEWVGSEENSSSTAEDNGQVPENLEENQKRLDELLKKRKRD